MMIGIYFSGTGNSRYCIEKLLLEYDRQAKACSIEEETAAQEIEGHEEIIFCYPVQFSNMPKIVKDFINRHHTLWRGKRVFVIATMGLFSGDGAGILARLLQKYGAEVIGGLHLKMPDSICDEKALKRSLEENRKLIARAEVKIKEAAENLQENRPQREGLGFQYHLAGLFGQRLYFYHKTKDYTDRLKIDVKKCIGCGKCVKLCPMKNLFLRDGTAAAGGRCTMCYRCICQCPAQAITLLGKQVVEQCYIEKYL